MLEFLRLNTFLILMTSSFAMATGACVDFYSKSSRGFTSNSHSSADRFKGFDKSLREFNKLVEELPSEIHQDPQDNRKYRMIESQDIDHVHDIRFNRQKRLLSVIIGLNQRLQTYMREGTVPRDPEKSFYSVFGELDNIHANHIITYGKKEKLYRPEDFSNFPEELRPKKPFVFREVVGFSRIEGKNTTSERDAGRPLFNEPPFKSYTVREISRMDVASRSPIDSLQHITHALNTIFKYSEELDLTKIRVVCSVYDKAHYKLWSSWGFEAVESLQNVPIKIGGTMDIMAIRGDKLREMLDKKNRELFELEKERAARFIEKANKKISDDLPSYLNGRTFFSQRINSTTELQVVVETAPDGRLTLIPYIRKDNGSAIKGRAVVSKQSHNTLGLVLTAVEIEIRASFDHGDIKEYKAKVFYPQIAGSIIVEQNSAFYTNSHRTIKNVKLTDEIDIPDITYAFHDRRADVPKTYPVNDGENPAWRRTVRQERWIINIQNLVSKSLLTELMPKDFTSVFLNHFRNSFWINGKLHVDEGSADSLLNLDLFYPQGPPVGFKTDTLVNDVMSSKLDDNIGIPAPSPVQLIPAWVQLHGKYDSKAIFSALGIESSK